MQEPDSFLPFAGLQGHFPSEFMYYPKQVFGRASKPHFMELGSGKIKIPPVGFTLSYMTRSLHSAVGAPGASIGVYARGVSHSEFSWEQELTS